MLESVEEWELQPDEAELAGFWLDLGSRVEKDSGWERIDWLVGKRLEKLAEASPGPAILYRDPKDGRLWEKTHPAAHMQDGGPPRLSVISPEAAAKRYGVNPGR